VTKTVSSNDTTKKFTWTITVNNPDGHDLSQDTFKDVIKTDSGSLTLPSSFTVHPVNGGADFTVAVDSDGTFHFPSGSTGSQYTITYTTDYPEGEAGTSVRVHNTVYDTPGGGTKTYENGTNGTGTIKGFEVGKTVYINSITSDGTVFTIPWGGTIDLPDPRFYSSDLSKLTFEDTMTTSSDGSGYGETLVRGTDYEVQKLDGTVIAADDQSEDPIYGFKVVFKDAALSKISGAQNLTYYYSSYADDSDQADNTRWRFKNAAAIPGHNTSAYYEYDKPRTEKDFVKESSATGVHDSFSESGTKVEYKNGKIYYRIIFTVPEDAGDQLTLTDILPAGLAIDQFSLHASFYMGSYDNDTQNGARLTVNDYFTHTSPETLPDGRTQVVFTIQKGQYQQDQWNPVKYSYQPGDKIDITYSASIGDQDFWKDLDKTSKVYENEVTFNNVTISNKTEVDRVLKTLDKQAQLLSNANGAAVIEYNVTVNPKGEDLNSSGDTVTLEDTLSIDKKDTVAHFVAQSLNVYAFDASKPNNIGAKLDANRYSYIYDTKTNKLTITLPDALACVVNYKYSFVLGEMDPTITNKASLQGLGVNTNDNGLKVQTTNTGAGVVRQEMYVYKVDADNNNILLNGVRFKLEKYDSSAADKWTEVTPRTHSLTTDTSGQLFFSKRDDGLEAGTLYRLTEVDVGDANKAKGYQKSSVPYYFMWVPVGDESKTDHDIYTASSASDSGLESQIQFVRSSGTMFVPNEMRAITVHKVWLNADNTDLNDPSKTAAVTLWRKYTYNTLPTVTVHMKDESIANTTNPNNTNPDTITATIPVAKGDGQAVLYLSGVNSLKVYYQNGSGGEGESVAKGVYVHDSGWNEDVYVIPIGSISTDVDYYLISDNHNEWDGWGKHVTLYTTPSVTQTTTNEDERAKDADGNVYPEETLTSGTSWSHTWVDLPARDEAGNTYYYYIKEEAVNGFTTTVTNNGGIEKGTITVTNKSGTLVRYSSFAFSKQWIDSQGQIKDDWQKDITVILTGKSSSGDQIASQFVITRNEDGSFTAAESAVTGKTEITSYSLVPSSSGGTFNFEFQNLPYADSNGNPYSYSLSEIKVDGYKSEYADSAGKGLADQNAGISNGQIVKNVEEGGVELPNTGGSGTIAYRMGGVLLVAGALFLYLLRRKKLLTL